MPARPPHYDLTSLFAVSLFPWSIFVFILDLTFKFFQCVTRDLPRGMSYPREVRAVILKPLRAGDVSESSAMEQPVKSAAAQAEGPGAPTGTSTCFLSPFAAEGLAQEHAPGLGYVALFLACGKDRALWTFLLPHQQQG